MKTKLVSILLCISLLFTMSALAACGDDPAPAPAGETTAAPAGETTAAPAENAATKAPAAETTAAPAETEYVYTPSADNLYQGMVGVGSYNTSVSYKSVKLVNNEDREILLDTDFADSNLEKWTYHNTGGTWDPSNTSDWTADADGLSFKKTDVQNAAICYGDTNWGNYNLTVKGVINEGTEGLRVYFAMQDDSNYYIFNCGGWSNTVATVEIFKDGASTTTDKIPYVFTYGEEYTITVNVKPDVILGFINGEQIFQIGGNQVAEADGFKGCLGFANWSTETYIDNISVVDLHTGESLYSNDFSDASTIADFKHDLATYSGGSYSGTPDCWVVEDEMLHQTDAGTTGVLSYFGDPNWTNIIYTIETTPVSGAEGTSILGAINLETPSYVLYNCGGWGNTVGCWQTYDAGTTNAYDSDGIATALTYDEANTLTLVITPYAIFSYINGTFFQAWWG